MDVEEVELISYLDRGVASVTLVVIECLVVSRSWRGGVTVYVCGTRDAGGHDMVYDLRRVADWWAVVGERGVGVRLRRGQKRLRMLDIVHIYR